MGDWLEMKKRFSPDQLLSEIEQFESDWKPYNVRKPNNRWGLSITSLDGGLSGIPDLDSLSEYNKKYNTKVKNSDICTYTNVYHQSPTLQKIVEPWKPWLGRCHFLRLDEGGYFPEHYDINKTDYGYDDIRLISFVKNTNKYGMKFLYEDKLIDVQDGTTYWFNASKRHSVFSMVNGCVMIVYCLKFDEKLFQTILEEYRLD
jgi:hypothetical protein